MYLAIILLGGALALRASARQPGSYIDMHPELELPSEEELEFMWSHPSQHSFRDLPCPDCPTVELDQNRTLYWGDDGPSYLMFHFSIEDDTLLANGVPIFPFDFPYLIFTVQHRGTPTARPSFTHRRGRDYKIPFEIGYNIDVAPGDPPHAYTPWCSEFFDVRFTVLDLDGHPVSVDPFIISVAYSFENDHLFMPKGAAVMTAELSRQLHEIDWRDRLASWTRKAIGRCPDKGKHYNLPFHFSASKESGHYTFSGFRSDFTHPSSSLLRFIAVATILGVSASLTAATVGMLFLWRRWRGTKAEDFKASHEQGEAFEKEDLLTESPDDVDVVPEFTEIKTSAGRDSVDRN